MSDDTVFLCEGCPTNCCETAAGMWTSEDELRSTFEGHMDKILVRWSNDVAFVYMKDNKPCPFLREGRCTIHETRPLDCRLFPYRMTGIFQRGNKIEISFDNASNCPKRDTLISEAEATEIVVKFGKMVYGEDKIIVPKCRRSLASQWLNLLELRLSRPRFVVGGESEERTSVASPVRRARRSDQ